MLTTMSLLLSTLRSKRCKYVPVSVPTSKVLGNHCPYCHDIKKRREVAGKNWKPENQLLFLDVWEYWVTREDCHPGRLSPGTWTVDQSWETAAISLPGAELTGDAERFVTTGWSFEGFQEAKFIEGQRRVKKLCFIKFDRKDASRFSGQDPRKITLCSWHEEKWANTFETCPVCFPWPRLTL